MKTQTDRILWLDYSRVFAMFIIVLSHTPVSLKFITPFTYVYLTTFFVCSGMMFDINRYSSFKDFFVRKFKSLMLPFITLHFISYFFWLIFDRNFGADVEKSYPWYEPLPDIFLGRFSIDNAPLWFLTALFSVEIIYFMLYKYIGQKRFKYVIPLFIIIGYLVQHYIDYKLPMMLHSAAVAIIFYSLGNVFKNTIFRYSKLNIYHHLIISVLGFVLVVFLSIPNGKIAMHTNQYGNYFLFLPLSILAMLVLESTCSILEKIIKKSQLIEYISRNLIVIVGFHMIVGKFIKAFTVFVLQQPLAIYEDKIIINLVFSLLSIILLIPLMYIINRYCPKLIGK